MIENHERRVWRGANPFPPPPDPPLSSVSLAAAVGARQDSSFCQGRPLSRLSVRFLRRHPPTSARALPARQQLDLARFRNGDGQLRRAVGRSRRAAGCATSRGVQRPGLSPRVSLPRAGTRRLTQPFAAGSGCRNGAPLQPEHPLTESCPCKAPIDHPCYRLWNIITFVGVSYLRSSSRIGVAPGLR